MSKITPTKNPIFIPASEWEISPWTKDMYDKHESEFRAWQGEYRSLRKAYNDDARVARYKWLEMKGGLTMAYDARGIISPSLKTEKYATTCSMFDKLTEWMSFQEKKTSTPETRRDTIKAMFVGMKKPEMTIPPKIKEEVKRDTEDITQDALDNF